LKAAACFDKGKGCSKKDNGPFLFWIPAFAGMTTWGAASNSLRGYLNGLIPKPLPSMMLLPSGALFLLGYAPPAASIAQLPLLATFASATQRGNPCLDYNIIHSTPKQRYFLKNPSFRSTGAGAGWARKSGKLRLLEGKSLFADFQKPNNNPFSVSL
jgi:hypothetical protein